MKNNPILVLCVVLVLLIGGMGCSLLTRATGEMPTPIIEEATVEIPPTDKPLAPATEPPPTLETIPTEIALPPAPETAVPMTCGEEICVFADVFPLKRPVAPEGREEIDVSYRFGTSDHGKRAIHHGVELLNPRGTPVLAAADGEVVLAGDDQKEMYGLYKNFYGNLVVLQHNIPGYDEPVYTLYAREV